jgi:hypothetical protein
MFSVSSLVTQDHYLSYPRLASRAPTQHSDTNCSPEDTRPVSNIGWIASRMDGQMKRELRRAG